MRRWVLPMLTLGVILPAAPAASAHNWAANTHLGNVETSGSADDLRVEGDIFSVENKCHPRRKVRIRTLEGELIDTARTDIQGHFRGRGDFSGTALIKVYVLKRDLDPGRDHKHLCKGDGPEFEKVQ